MDLLTLLGDAATPAVKQLLANVEEKKKKGKRKLIRRGLQPTKNFTVGAVKPDAKIAHQAMNPVGVQPPTYWSIGAGSAASSMGFNEGERKRKAKSFYDRPAPNVKAGVPTQSRFWMGMKAGFRNQYGQYDVGERRFVFGNACLDEAVTLHGKVDKAGNIDLLISELTLNVVAQLLEMGEGGQWITVDGRHIFIGKQSDAGHLQRGQTTKEAFHNAQTGEWHPTRQKIHDDAAGLLTQGKTSHTDRAPIAYILGGGTASGKTSASRKIMGDDPNVVRVDPDELKLHVPEYQALKESDPENAALRVHSESKQITAKVMAAAIAKRLDLTYDATTSGTAGPLMIKELLHKGYDVRVAFVDIPISEAVKRSAKRALESTDPIDRGRVVPEDVIKETHRDSAERFFEVKDIPGLTSARMYDNSQRPGDPPSLVYERNHGGEEIVHNSARYEQYKNKARGKAE